MFKDPSFPSPQNKELADSIKDQQKKSETLFDQLGESGLDEYLEALKKSLLPEFSNKSLTEIIGSDAGWEKLTQDFLENTYPEDLETESYYDVNTDIFGEFKTKLIPLLFKNNPKKAREFFSYYLINLSKLRERELVKRKIRIASLKHLADEEAEEFIDEDPELEKDEAKNLRPTTYQGIDEELEIFHAVTPTIIAEFTKHGETEDLANLIQYINNDPYSRYHIDDLSACFHQINAPAAANELFEQLTNGENSEIYILILTDLLTAETVRQKLNEKIEDEKDQSCKGRLESVRALITPNHDKIAIENLQKFYQEKIKFEDYKVNQKMNASEVKLLQEIIGKDDKVLEEGCGTGRLFLEMEKAGYDIAGFDFTARHIKIIREQNPVAKVLQDDWHHTKFRDESFDTVYSLGRNILHDYSIADQAQVFREAARILKSGGKFIFDIPNREKGGYKEMVDEYGKEMKARGIKNFRQGTIYDSPDGVNFTTRYAYSEDDIKLLADLAGFKITEVRKEELTTGKGDENLYFVLEKILSRK